MRCLKRRLGESPAIGLDVVAEDAGEFGVVARSLDGDSNADHIGTPNRGLGLALVAIRGNAKLYPCALDHIRASPPSDGVLAEA